MHWEFSVTSSSKLKYEALGQTPQEAKQKMVLAMEMMNKTARAAEQLLPTLNGLHGNEAASEAATKLRSKLKELYVHISTISGINLGLDEQPKTIDALREIMAAAAQSVLLSH